MQVAAGSAVRLPLDTDSVAVAVRRPGERVAAEQRSRLGIGPQADGQELAGPRRGGARVIRGSEADRDHGRALPVDADHGESSEPGPGERGSGRRIECFVPRDAGVLIEQSLEGPPPALTQRRDAQGTSETATRVAGQVEQAVYLGHAHGFGAGGDFHNGIAGMDLPLLQHSEVEARSTVGDEQRRHPGLVHPDPDPVARHAWLRDLQECSADAVLVADADLVVRKAFDREVLAELPVCEVVPAEVLLPVAVGLDLIDEHGTLLSTVSGQVTLPVAIDVQTPHHPAAVNRVLPYPGVDDPALPLDVLRETDVDRQEPRHPCQYATPGEPLQEWGGRLGSGTIDAMSLPGFVDGRLTVGEASYFVASGGAGPPTLLLHGFPETHLCWEHVAPQLAGTHHVVCPDLRGYGASEAAPGGPRGEGYSKREMAGELVELMVASGHERFAVVGHDRGARVAPAGARSPRSSDARRRPEHRAHARAVRAHGRRSVLGLLALVPLGPACTLP